MEKSGVWDQVKELLDQGEIPVVEFPEVYRVIRPRGPVGSYRKYPIGTKDPKSKYYRMKSPSGFAMYCRWRGCKRLIPVHRGYDIVCSNACKNLMKEYCEIVLDILNGKTPAQEYPMHLRNRMLR